MYDNGQAMPQQTVMEAAEAGPRCAVCGFPALDRSRWARLGLIGLWKFGTPLVPLCVVCHQFGTNLVQIKDIVIGELRKKGIHIGVPTEGVEPPGAPATRSAPREDPELGRPPGMPQGAEQ
jgi:hypothetical protein